MISRLLIAAAIALALLALLPPASAQTDLQWTGDAAPGHAVVIAPVPSPVTGADAGAPPALALSGTSIPLTGGTITPAVNTTLYLINPAGTLAALTYNLPAFTGPAGADGNCHRFLSTQIITALTLGTAAYTSAIGLAAPTTLAANTEVRYCFVGTVAVRVQ